MALAITNEDILNVNIRAVYDDIYGIVNLIDVQWQCMKKSERINI